MNSKQIGVVAGIIAVLGMALQTVPASIIGGWGEGTMPSWVPMFGTLGTTVLMYTTLVNLLTPLVTIGLAVGLGYYGGTADEFRADYRRVCGRVAVGCIVAVVIAWSIVMWVGASFSSFDIWTVLLIVGSFLQFLVSGALPVIIGVLAGAAVAMFRDSDGRRHEPTTDTLNSAPETTNH